MTGQTEETALLLLTLPLPHLCMCLSKSRGVQQIVSIAALARSLAFFLFGALYVGAAQYVMYVW